MRPVARFGFIILIASFLLAIVVSLYFFFNEGTINLTMLVLPSIGVIVGIGFMIGGFGSYLALDDEIENFEHLVGDDIEELSRGNLTYTHLKTAVTVIAILTEIALIFIYQKWDAIWWGWMPVIIIAVICIVAILYGGVTMNWFQNRQRRTRWWVFVLFFVGWAVSAWVGIYYSEPIEFVETPRSTISQTPSTNYNYGYRYTRASDWDWVSFDGLDFAFSCDEDCEGLLLLVVIVVVVVICIVASATIPHFWVVATCLLLSAMALVALRELLVVESSWTSKKGKA